MGDRAGRTTFGRALRKPSRTPLLRRIQPALQAGRLAGGPRLLQPALKVGPAGDPTEREAEATAERIVAMPAPQLAPAEAAPSGPPAGDARRASVEDQPSTDELETLPPIPEDHQDPVVPPEEDVDAEALTAGDMQELESGVPVDTGGDGGDHEAQAARSGGAAVVGIEGGPAPADVARRVAAPGAGRPLPESVRSFMEPRFGSDFSAVRIHDAPDDRRAAQRIGARAFTHREHIFVGPGESVEDRRLMAHELTHVVQQTAPGPARAAARATDGDDPPVRRGYILNKAEKYARHVPGYRLIEVILGRSPITGERIERNAINLLGALMALMPGGNLLFERLQEARVIEEAFNWISSRLDSLNITWSRIVGIVEDIIDYMPDWPSDMIAYAKRKLAPLVDDILTFISEVGIKILEFIVRGALRLAGPWGERIWEIIQQAGAVLRMILEDPLGFARNLFEAVLRGFRQFGSSILTHIKRGLLGWLFGAIRGLDIEMPERLDFKGLVSIGLQVVGLTYANFRAQLVRRLGANGERKVAFLEKSVEAVKILVREGFVGLWQRALQMIDNFRETIVDGIRSFVIDSLIMGGLSWLAGLSNPVGAVVRICLAIYNIIKTFLERLDQILDVAQAIFSSIGAIAAGRVQAAADFIERTLAATIPVVISFLAALVPVTGITNAVRNIINRLRDAVNRAIERMITFVVKKAKKLFSGLIARLNRRRKLPSVTFAIGATMHRMYAKKDRRGIDIYVQSDEQKAATAAEGMKAELSSFKEGSDSAREGKQATDTFDAEENRANAAADRVDPDSEKANQRGPMELLEQRLADASQKISDKARPLADNPDVKTDDPVKLIRAVEPRFEDEGLVGTYSAIKQKTSEPAHGTGLSFSEYYEADHLPEKSLLQAAKAGIAQFTGTGQVPGAAAPPPQPARPEDTLRERPEAAVRQPGAAQPATQPRSPGFGRLAELADEPGGDGTSLNSILLYRPVHRLKPATFSAPTRRALSEIAAGSAPAAEKETRAKAAIEQQVHDEAAALKRIYSESDENSAGELRRRVFGRIDEIVARSNTDFNLSARPAPQTAEAGGPGAEGARNALAFGGPQDFAHREGIHGPYAGLGATGAYIERDHVIDQSFPEAAKHVGFGDVLDGPIDVGALADKAPDDAARRSLRARAGALRRRAVFASGSPIAGYTEGTGLAINLYRAVHRRVTRRSASAGAAASIRSAFTADAFRKTAGYVRGEPGAAISDADAEMRAAVRAAFERQLDLHVRAVSEEYSVEMRNVEQANPGREAAARSAMQPITDRVGIALADMRRQSLGLVR